MSLHPQAFLHTVTLDPEQVLPREVAVTAPHMFHLDQAQLPLLFIPITSVSVRESHQGGSAGIMIESLQLVMMMTMTLTAETLLA